MLQKSKKKSGVLEVERRLFKKKALLKKYEDELKEYEKTKKKDVKPKKYDTMTSEDSSTESNVIHPCYVWINAAITCMLCIYLLIISQSSSDEFSTMDEDDLVPLEGDSYQLGKLKQKCKRLVSRAQ